MPSGFFLKKKPPCILLDGARELKNRFSRIATLVPNSSAGLLAGCGVNLLVHACFE